MTAHQGKSERQRQLSRVTQGQATPFFADKLNGAHCRSAASRIDSVSSDCKQEVEVGSPLTLWSASKYAARSHDNAPVAPMQQREFRFSLPIPDTAPPSLSLGNNGGVRVAYEVIASCTYLRHGGCFSLSKLQTVKTVCGFYLDKYETLPAWPIYKHQASLGERVVEACNVRMQCSCVRTAFGPGDAISVILRIRSQRADPVKLVRVRVILREVITTRETGKNPDASHFPTSKQSVNDVVDVKVPFESVIYTSSSSEECSTFHAEALMPKIGRWSCTTPNIDVSYHLKITAGLQKINTTAAEDLQDLVLDNLPVIISSHNYEEAKALIPQIVEFYKGIYPVHLQQPGANAAENDSEGDSSTLLYNTHTPMSLTVPNPQGPLAPPSHGGPSPSRSAASSTRSRPLSQAFRSTSYHARLPKRDSQVRLEASLHRLSQRRQSTQPNEEEKRRLFNEARARVEASGRIVSAPLPQIYAGIADEKERQYRTAFTAPSQAQQTERSAIDAYEQAVATRQQQAEQVMSQFKQNSVHVASEGPDSMRSAMGEKARLAERLGYNSTSDQRPTNNSLDFGRERDLYEAAVRERDRLIDPHNGTSSLGSARAYPDYNSERTPNQPQDKGKQRMSEALLGMGPNVIPSDGPLPNNTPSASAHSAAYGSLR